MQTIKKFLHWSQALFKKNTGLDFSYFVKNGFWVVTRLSVELISGLVLSIVFARLASQEVYGQYQFIFSAVFATVSVVAIQAMNTSLTKASARGCDGDYKPAAKKVFLWSLLGIPIILLVGVYYYFYKEPLLGMALMISAVFFPFFYAPKMYTGFLQGKSRFDIITKYGGTQALINALVMIATLFLVKDNLLVIVLVYLLVYCSFNVYFFWRSLKYIENDKKDEDTIKYGMFLNRLSIVGIIANNIDRLLIGFFISPVQLAIYSVGMLFSRQIMDMSKSLLWLVNIKSIEYKILTKRAYLKIFIGSVLVTVFCLGAFRFIIPWLFSDKYQDSIFLSEISILFFPFFVVALLYNNEYVLGAKKKILFAESFITPTIRIILTLIVLPFFGIKGLAFLAGFHYIVNPSVLYLVNAFHNKNLEKKMAAEATFVK